MRDESRASCVDCRSCAGTRRTPHAIRAVLKAMSVVEATAATLSRLAESGQPYFAVHPASNDLLSYVDRPIVPPLRDALQDISQWNFPSHLVGGPSTEVWMSQYPPDVSGPLHICMPRGSSSARPPSCQRCRWRARRPRHSAGTGRSALSGAGPLRLHPNAASCTTSRGWQFVRTPRGALPVGGLACHAVGAPCPLRNARPYCTLAVSWGSSYLRFFSILRLSTPNRPDRDNWCKRGWAHSPGPVGGGG